MCMAQATESVDIEAPVSIVYNTWTKFEDFPRFLTDVESVAQVSDDETEWKVKVGGIEHDFAARITEQHPDERVAWRTNGGGVDHAGVVTFHRLADDRSR